MKNQIQKITSFILLTIITLTSCEFNESVNKDLTTGAYLRGSGIGSDDVIIEINGKAEKRNEFIFGEKVNFVFNDISGLTKVDGKTYPGLSMHILKNEKDTLLSHSDLFENFNEGTQLSPLQAQANFMAALPNQDNEKYKVYIEIWDKKGDGKLNYELPFVIKNSDLITIKNQGLKYSNIYLRNETLKQPVLDNRIRSDHKFALIFYDIEGLEIINDKVYPILSLDLFDNNGNKVLSNANLLSAYEEEGINKEDFFKNNKTSAEITLAKGSTNNPYTLSATLKDKNSSKKISVTTELNIH